MTATASPSPPASQPRAARGPRVAFFSAYWLMAPRIEFGASDYWRMGVPGAELAENGWDVMLSTCLAARKDGVLQVRDIAGRWHDDREVIVLQRWMGEGMDRHIRRARAAGQVIVNDVDDYYWALPRGHEALSGTDPARHQKYNRDLYRGIIKASSLVTVSTPFLRGALERWGPPVEVVRNHINLFSWRVKPPGEHVGWVGAVPWRDSDLSVLRDTVVPWLRERDLPFYHGGHMNKTRSVRELLGYDRVTIEPARPINTYPLLWDPLRIALIPMVNSTFNASKSWVKGLEACARGIPFIASDHPEYRELGVGRLVTRPHQWREHLDALQDPEVYAEEAAQARARALSLSIKDRWTAWDAVLREALRTAT